MSMAFPKIFCELNVTNLFRNKDTKCHKRYHTGKKPIITLPLPLILATTVRISGAHTLRARDFDTDVVDNIFLEERRKGECLPGVAYIGCFEDRKRDRALPYQVEGQFHKAEDCMSACQGYAIFARQLKGQCFCKYIIICI